MDKNISAIKGSLVIALVIGFFQPTVFAQTEPPSLLAAPIEKLAQGEPAMQAMGQNMATIAQRHQWSEAKLKHEMKHDDSLWVDQSGALLYMDPKPEVSLAEASAAYAPEVESGPFPFSQTFFLNSKPDSNRVIYLDFDGHTITGTAWNSNYGSTIVARPYSIDSNINSFSNAELDRIQNVWLRVAEDFAPFDVNVTTQDPGAAAIIRSSSSDTRYGTRVVITEDTFANCGCGGFAYVGVFDNTGSFYKPAFVFNNSEIGVAEATTHEVGHNLGLSHDGTSSVTYYSGHGSGATGWASIMGAGYYQPLTQWSKGEYFDANNQQDDLIIIRNNGLNYRLDDHGASIAGASSLETALQSTEPPTFNVTGRGIIERNTDIDTFGFLAGAGEVLLNVNPVSLGANLDMEVQLLDESGLVLADSNPVNTLNATIATTLPIGGEYFLSVTGVGKGNPQVTGYSDYASLGQYTITGNILVPGDLPPSVTNPGEQYGAVGYDFTLAIQALDLSGATIFYDAVGLPDGLFIDQLSGIISGSPTVSGTFTVTVTVSNDTEEGSSTAFDIIVTNAPNACIAPSNIASLGSASQSSSYSNSFSASLGINNNTTDFTHTSSTETNASWQLDLGQDMQLNQLVLHNRDNCCQNRLRDITVSIENQGGATTYITDLLNPEDILSGPATITIDLPFPVIGSRVTVGRTSDPDLSGGGSSTADSNVLSLAEVMVQGCSDVSTDFNPPEVIAPADISIEATAALTPVVLGTATANDDIDGDLSAAVDDTGPFPVGDTTVTWSATDSAGNTGTDSQLVSVVDTTAPVLTAPADLVEEASGPLSAVSIIAPIATDLVDGSITATLDNPGPYALGDTLVTWTAVDSAGNSVSDTHTITVVDTTGPVVTPPGDISMEATAVLTEVTLGTATATDAVEGAVSVNVDHTGPFAIGSILVTWSAVDSQGNLGSGQQSVTVVDSTPPTLDVPGDVVVVSDIPIAIDIGTASSSDLFAVTVSHDAPALFPVGLTVVTWVSEDANGNRTELTQDVVVNPSPDILPPVVTAPGDIVAEATSLLTPVSLGTASANDNRDGVLVATIDNTGPYPLGVTVVTWSATDAAGNTASDTQTVTVVDTTAPVITPIADRDDTVNSVVSLQVIALDNYHSALTYAAANLPVGLNIDTGTGLISGTASTLGSQTVTLTVGDGLQTAQVQFNWSIISEITLNPVADSYVRLGIFGNTNYGSSNELRVKFGNNPSYIRRSYLKFDLSTAGTVGSAILRVYGSNVQNTISGSITAHGVTDDSWTELGLTANNAPSVPSAVLAGATFDATLGYRDFDITAFIESQRNADGTASIALQSTVDAVYSLSSRETAQSPELVLTLLPPPPPPRPL